MKNRMMNIITITLIGILLLIPNVNVVAKSSDSKANSEAKAAVAEKKASMASAAEKRVQIKINLTELQSLRAQLRTKILNAKTEMNQYREKTQLTEQERAQIRKTIDAIKETKQTLGAAYQNITAAMTKYKGDQSTDKLTGLDIVITSQQERIALLKTAIAQF